MSERADWLWSRVHDLFEVAPEEDGTWSEDIDISYRNPASVPRAFELMRRVGTLDHGNATPTFRSVATDSEHSLDSVPNAADLVVAGEVNHIYLFFSEVRSGGLTLPRIGIFFWPDGISLDYEPMAGWSGNSLDAFFQLIHRLMSLDADPSMPLEGCSMPDVQKRIRDIYPAWAVQYEVTEGNGGGGM